MKRISLIITLLLALAGLAGCSSENGALTPQQAARQSLQNEQLDQEGLQILGNYPLPDGKSLVVFSYVPQPEDGKPMTALGYSLLEHGRLGLWREISRGSYTKEALDLAGETIDYEIALQPGEVEAVFGRVVEAQVGEVNAVYDDGHQVSDKNIKDGFVFFADEGAYPVVLNVIGKDGQVLDTVELKLMESVAMESLTQFFAELHDGSYTEAAQLYGGSYQELADMNTLIDPTDYAALWKNACKVNGFQCLNVGSIGPKGKTATGEFIFLVEFIDEQGNTFQREPCCGESGSSTQSAFEYRVKKTQGGQFKVMDMPVYVP